MQKMLTPAQSAERLWQLLIAIGEIPFPGSPSVSESVPKQLIDGELFLLRLSVMVFFLQFSRHATWRENGLRVHDLFFISIFDRLSEHNPNYVEYVMQAYPVRMITYGSAMHPTASTLLSGDPLPTSASVGTSFAVNCGFPSETALCEIGAMEFTRTFDAIESLFSQYQVTGENP
jgi:hypothetical protein